MQHGLTHARIEAQRCQPPQVRRGNGWAIDRLGRSLIDLLDTIQHLEAVGVDLYLDQQSIDTTTPAGKLLFQLTGAFAEFERSMIRQRVRRWLSVIEVKLERDGKLASKAWQGAQEAWPAGAEPDKSIVHDASWQRASASARWRGQLA